MGAYLAEVAARLGGGPTGIRRDILAELGAGLASGTVVIDVTVLTLLAIEAASTPGRLAALPAAAAAAASCTRLAFATRAARASFRWPAGGE